MEREHNFKEHYPKLTLLLTLKKIEEVNSERGITVFVKITDDLFYAKDKNNKIVAIKNEVVEEAMKVE
jgi:hypothetical protein